MTDLNDGAATRAKDLRVGRLASHLDGFETLLGGQGYVPATVRQKIDLLAGFSAWVEKHNVPLGLLGDEHAGRFLTDYRRRARRGDAWSIQQFIGYLRDIGCVPVSSAEVHSNAEDDLVATFAEFLRTERGLSASTLANYLPIVR